MRRVLSLAGAAALALLAGAASAEAQTMNFTALLSGSNETPGIASGSGGTATVMLNTATRTVTYKIDVYNLPSGATAAHFHAGGPGVSGPVSCTTRNPFFPSATYANSELYVIPSFTSWASLIRPSAV